MTFGLILTTIAVMIGVTAPDVPILLTAGTVGAIALFGPLVLYPVSYTVWQAVDLLMRGPTDDELAGLADASL